MSKADTKNFETVGREFETFFRLLRLPERPVSIADAAEAWKQAKADLATAQAKHQEAGSLLHKQRLGQAPTMTHTEVDELGSRIAPAIAAEQEAKAEYQRQVAEYAATATDALRGPLEQYHDAIVGVINELESLLSLGTLLQSESAAAKIPLPSKITALCPHMGVHIGALRGILQLSKK